MKTAMKRKQHRLGAKIEIINDKSEVLLENMWTHEEEMKPRIGVSSPGWTSAKPGQRPLKKK
jgi:hypothetical protein